LPRVKVPVTPVVPVTDNVYVLVVAKVVPLPMVRFPPTDKAAPSVAVAVPLKVRLPLTVVIAPKVSAPPLKVRLE